MPRQAGRFAPLYILLRANKRNYLAGATGDAINAVLAAAGYNFRRLLAWLAILFALLAHTLRASLQPNPA